MSTFQQTDIQLSVVVPVYNSEKYLEACVHSILRQDVPGMEIILVDDGSTDGSADICKKLCASDVRVHGVHQCNAGAGAARNAGIAAAKGRYIAFADSDDLLTDGMYGALLSALESAGADAAICAFARFFGDSINRRRESPLDDAVLQTRQEVYKQWLGPLLGGLPGSSPVSSSACRCVYKTDIIQRHGIQFLSERSCLSEDLIFNVDYFAHCTSVVTISQAYYLYRDNPASFSRAFDLSRFESLKHLVSLLAERCAALPLPSEEYVPRLAYRFVEYTSVFTRQAATRLPLRQARAIMNQFANDKIFVAAAADCIPRSMAFSLRLFRWLMCRRWYSALFVLINAYSRLFPPL